MCKNLIKKSIRCNNVLTTHFIHAQKNFQKGSFRYINHSCEKYKYETLKSIKKIHEAFELPSQDVNATKYLRAIVENPNLIIKQSFNLKPQNPRVVCNVPSGAPKAIAKPINPNSTANQQHKCPTMSAKHHQTLPIVALLVNTNVLQEIKITEET